MAWIYWCFDCSFLLSGLGKRIKDEGENEIKTRTWQIIAHAAIFFSLLMQVFQPEV